MTKKPGRVRIFMTSRHVGGDQDQDKSYSGPATVLSGLPRTIRRHELRLIVPLADSTIFGMEQRGEFPHRFNLSPRCVVWDLEEIEAWLEERRAAYFAGTARIAAAPDVRQRRTRPLKPAAG
ncbi:MAG: helix-turn-helix transcriptional regulator [Novosphingobium sp.]